MAGCCRRPKWFSRVDRWGSVRHSGGKWKPNGGASARRIQRYVFGGAAEADLDRQGRVMIPGHLIEYASLGREVVVIGIHDHLEIWDRAAWRRELERLEGSAEDVAERLAAQRD